jgi:hypothetical protein
MIDDGLMEWEKKAILLQTSRDHRARQVNGMPVPSDLPHAALTGNLRIHNCLRIGSQDVPIRFVRHIKARRYILRVQPDGMVRVTMPRGGSQREAHAFAQRNTDWIAKQLQKRQAQTAPSNLWQEGTEILYRGEKVALKICQDHGGLAILFADQVVPLSNAIPFRVLIEDHLRRLATAELTERTHVLAAQHELRIAKVIVRGQRTRWGSCSRRGTISLNWRLIQMTESVRDYIILHELAHTLEHNHSAQFWRLVERLCPGYQEAEKWIQRHHRMIMG